MSSARTTKGVPSAAQAVPAGSVEAVPAGSVEAVPTGAGEALGRSFKGAMAAVRRLRGRESHRPGALSDAQYSLLFGLRERDAVRTSELAVAADLSPASTTEMLDGLVTAGLVTRIRSEQDRRVVLTSLTERGRELVEGRRADIEPRWRAALAGFSERELLTAAAVLDSLRGLFDQLAAERVDGVEPVEGIPPVDRVA
jgi:MarR family transcriptional regulator, organic hydroperoxide resistance regulator